MLSLASCAEGTVNRAPDSGAPPDAPPAADAGPSDTGADAPPEPDAGPPPEDSGPSTGPTACTPADAATVCGGRPCVDGYCCDTPCTETCRSCGLAGAEGTCTAHDAGTDPDGECEAQSAASCGTDGECDGSGACRFYGAEVTCDDGESCTNPDTCDGSGACRGAAPDSCGPGAGNECCVGSCTDGAGCSTVAGRCADACDANVLSYGQGCSGCGSAGAVGTCTGGATARCDESSHVLCQEQACGGSTYYCTVVDGSWAWRTVPGCDDGDACTHTDVCSAGVCGGTSVDCSDTECATRACNGSPTCTVTPNTGASCEDGDLCTYNDTCDASGACAAGSTITCDDAPCIDRECNGSFTCTEMILSGSTCDDGDACTSGSTCSAAGVCMGGTMVGCDTMDTTCMDFTCDGAGGCTGTPRNIDAPCDDGDAATDDDRCQADGVCRGFSCPPTLTTAFADDFASPSSSSWTAGSDANVNGSRWQAWTTEQHGVRINSGRLEITNERSGFADHGHGYAYVRAGGAGSHYDNTIYDATLANNAGSQIVWTLNMRRDDPETTDGGFDCDRTSSQNHRTVGLAYVLGTDGANALHSSAGTCDASASGVGYAVIAGDDGYSVRLVRFQNGLRNGAITTLVASGGFTPRTYFSVRVTYTADTNGWRLEARSDGTSSFDDPATGSYGFSGTATDGTYTATPLEFSGPYFQTGCSGTCGSVYTSRFDNVRVGVQCAP